MYKQDRENFRVKVTDVNSGGLLATLESLPAFVPYSLMDKSQDGSWMSIEVRSRLSVNSLMQASLVQTHQGYFPKPHLIFSVVCFR